MTDRTGPDKVLFWTDKPSSAERQKIKLEQFAAQFLDRFPLGALVRWVAGIRASVHTKLLAGFLIVTLLFITMAAVSYTHLTLPTKA